MTQTEQDQQPFTQYLAGMEQVPLLGHLVLYSIFDGHTTRERLGGWFEELDLDPVFLPPEIRPVDAFEKVTGDVKHTYPLDDPAAHQDGQGRRKRDEGEPRVATLLVRHVRRNGDVVVRHLVREVRDAEQERLDYEVKVGECVFRRDTTSGALPGAGQLHTAADFAGVPDEREQREIRAVLDQVAADFRHHCRYLTGDRLRATVRNYVEALNAIKVRPTGGVYFVHEQYRGTLVKLRELVKRFGAGSGLYLVPLPDEAELREMVVQAFRTKARDDLQRLAKEIAAACRADSVRESTVEALHKRFRQLEAAAGEHGRLLAVDLEDTGDALDLVRRQLHGLLTAAE
jgi:Family of unknown function (DUF6744)